MKSCYIAGPMRGVKFFNFPRFHEVAALMRERGWHVFNPAEHDEYVWPGIAQWPGYATGDVSACPEFNLATSMRWDVARIAESDAIVLLPAWQRSVGATFERMVAHRCGLKMLYASRVTGKWEVMEE